MLWQVPKAIDIDPRVLDEPVYTAGDVARYVGVPRQTVRYWGLGRHSMPPLFEVPENNPPVFSFANLLECHVLNAMRTTYELDVRKVRSALETLASKFNDSRHKHPLLTEEFRTNGIDLFIHEGTINLSRGGQATLQAVLDVYLERIEWSVNDYTNFYPLKFYPFVYETTPDEPRIVSIAPTIAAGRSVIDGTGISTAVIASRFFARETPEELAVEYELSERQILEAVIWEGRDRSGPQAANLAV
jgi:uncharacterized protein (DUF433 family)